MTQNPEILPDCLLPSNFSLYQMDALFQISSLCCWHRDLYLCHLHINKEIDFNNIQIYLIDLHRAQIRSKVPHRWIVKDLGGFIHSILQFDLTERDFYRFMMTYHDCTFREFTSNYKDTTKEILSRAFSMYLKPNLKVFTKN